MLFSKASKPRKKLPEGSKRKTVVSYNPQIRLFIVTIHFSNDTLNITFLINNVLDIYLIPNNDHSVPD